MNGKIIVISEYFYPNERTDAFLLTQITKKLAEVSDGNIEVICTSDLGKREEIKLLQNKITRLKSSQISDKNIVLRVLKFIILTFRLSSKAFFSIKENDRVFLTTNPAFLIPIISLLRKFKKFEYTLLIYDVFPENLSAANILSNKSLFYKFIKIIYDWAYSKADRLIVLGRDMDEIISLKIKYKSPTYLIENWCDYKSVAPMQKSDNNILKDLGLVDKTVFLFAGNLGRVQGISTLLRAATLVKDENFVLLFIGNGACKLEIIDFISLHKNSNVYYAGSFPIAKKNEFLNACDVAIVSLSKSMYGLGVPSKSYYNMAAEKPILYIGDVKSEISQVLNDFELGWTIEPNDEIKLAKLIDKICVEKDNFTLLGKKAREVVKDNFSKEIILNKYAKLYGERK